MTSIIYFQGKMFREISQIWTFLDDQSNFGWPIIWFESNMRQSGMTSPTYRHTPHLRQVRFQTTVVTRKSSQLKAMHFFHLSRHLLFISSKVIKSQTLSCWWFRRTFWNINRRRSRALGRSWWSSRTFSGCWESSRSFSGCWSFFEVPV